MFVAKEQNLLDAEIIKLTFLNVIAFSFQKICPEIKNKHFFANACRLLEIRFIGYPNIN